MTDTAESEMLMAKRNYWRKNLTEETPREITLTIRLAPVNEHMEGWLVSMSYESPKLGLQRYSRAYCKDVDAIDKRVEDAIKRITDKEHWRK